MIESFFKVLFPLRRFSYLIITLLFILSYHHAYGREMVVIGQEDRLPVAGATLLSGSGHIIGITDHHGKVELPENTSFPVTLRSMGYEVEITSHSVEEYKELRKSVDPLAFRMPETMLPEIPAVTDLKNRFTDR